MLKTVCEILIKNGKTEGLSEKLAVFCACGDLTTADYEELSEMIIAGGAE